MLTIERAATHASSIGDARAQPSRLQLQNSWPVRSRSIQCSSSRGEGGATAGAGRGTAGPGPSRSAPAVDAKAPVTTRRSLLGSAAVAAAGIAASPLVLTSPSSAAAVAGRHDPALGFETRVEEFTLPNGLHFIVLPRRTAPVVACHTYANVGAWNEAEGVTGMAHLLEHMAFKGTPRIGTLDFAREAPLLDALDEAFYELRDVQASISAGAGGGKTRVSTLRSRLRALQDQAAALTVPNAFGAALQQAGGVGLNATTSHDETRYFCSLPSNKLELWMALEAERFRAPVFRELYSEKAVIEEERRLRVDNAPMGRFQQEFALRSLANPYRRPVIGFEEDFDAIGRREVQAFFDRFYGPANLTIAVVGDVSSQQVHRLAEKYWGGWQGPPGYTVLPRGSPFAQQPGGAGGAWTAAGGQGGAAWGPGEADPRPRAFLAGEETSYRAAARAGPSVFLGYYRPPMTCREGVVLEVLSDVLSGGRTSRLVSELVLSGRLLSAAVVTGYPGEAHPGMALVYGIPNQGDSPEVAEQFLPHWDSPEVAEQFLTQQLALLAQGGVGEAELVRVQRASRAGLLGAAQSNGAMASALASYHVQTGSWRGLSEELELVTQLRAPELQDVAQRVFRADNRFTGYVLKG
ncbi:hypothetical protein HYH03_015713 [Edaphochlamys debaryana]|uniref:Uncharacterized protein n=1 Tax=Edaphochlamys debaryana TaxID=47281 RepID=A0A836BS73_9CHLO|nr:hypothetical protein HYH03_015713 [Edaphochlamys debaryana]|eukprot:KAG2485544.1 hypothetical protein HYH03_015713 [Edaphochlamys debaryana]